MSKSNKSITLLKKTSSKGKLAVMLVSPLALLNMKRLSRNIFQTNISDTEAIKALALLIFVKNIFPTSVIPNYTNYKLAKLTGLHKETVKRRINTLGDMELIELEGRKNQHVRFLKVRAPKSNIRLDRIDLTSIKSIELGLKAMLIVEIQNQKNFIEQRVIRATSPKEHCSSEEYKAFKRSKKYCTKRGIKNFKDNGISYKTIGKKLGVGKNKVSEVIKYAVNQRMLNKHRHIEELTETRGEAMNIVYAFSECRLFTTKRNNKVLSYSCNTYSIPSSFKRAVELY